MIWSAGHFSHQLQGLLIGINANLGRAALNTATRPYTFLGVP